MEQTIKTIHLMGTVINLMIEHEDPEPILEEAARRLKMYEHRFSANDPSSELMAINQQAGIRPVSVHPELYDLVKIGKFHSCSPDSNLNIAIGPLVQTWRIGFQDAKVPTAEEVEQLLKKTDPEKIVFNDQDRSVFLTEPGMLIDLGSLAKGYIADLLITFLKSRNVESALINLGGNIVGLGPSPKQEKDYWNIGIQNPLLARNHYLTVLKIANQSVVTSGIYERNLKDKGKTYHHILDPHTGYPTTTDVASLTIRSTRSLDGEIWTTRLYGKNSEEIIQDLNQREGIDGLVVTKNEKILYSKGLAESI